MNNIIEIIKKIVKKDSFRLTDDFFLIGGNSIKALILVEEINRIYGINISVEEVFEQQSVNDILDLVKQKIASEKIEPDQKIDAIIHLNQVNKNFQNLFLIPPVLGTPLVFREMASKFSYPFNLLGLEYPGFRNADEMMADFELLTSNLYDQIIKKQNSGTFYILGYSMGGILAFELAKKIEGDLNAKVKLFLIDSMYLNQEMHSSFIDEMKMNYKIEDEVEIYRDYLDREKILHYQLLLRNNSTLFMNYIIKGSIEGDIIAFEATQSKIDMNKWFDYTSGNFLHFYVEGNHSTILNNIDFFNIL